GHIEERGPHDDRLHEPHVLAEMAQDGREPPHSRPLPAAVEADLVVDPYQLAAGGAEGRAGALAAEHDGAYFIRAALPSTSREQLCRGALCGRPVRSLSILRRMPTGGHPKSSRQDEARPIQLERCYRCASYGCRPIDPSRALGPGEVLLPFLLTRIEDSHFRSGLRIDDEKPVALMVVTERTGQPQVVFRRWPAEGSWKQMIEFHGFADDNFPGQAVTTAVSRLLCHSTAQVDGDVGGAHW